MKDNEIRVAFPSLALEWIICNSVESDRELAAISNVCESWRETLMRTLKSHPQEQANTNLLLTTFVQRVSNGGTNNEKSNNPEDSNHNESFCIAWFAPEGLRETWIPRNPNADFQDEDSASGGEDGRSIQSALLEQTPFAPSGEHGLVGSDDERTRRGSRRSRNLKRKTFSNNILQQKQHKGHSFLVAEEWRGYQTPYEVFRHFGFTKTFLMALLEHVHASPDILANSFAAHATTDVVRGATVARPESYCFCFDKTSNEDLPLELAMARQAEHMSDQDRHLMDIKKREYKQAIRRKARRKRELRRETLPRILVRSENDVESMDQPSPPVSIQFLNGPGDHAVCMLTPLLETGPLPTPITIFCVGIATEDGCFLSGLRHRFELGHLYPSDALSELTELSPICVATEKWDPGSKSEGHIGRPSGPYFDEDGCIDMLESSSGIDDSSAENSDNSGYASTVSCKCVFQGVGEKVAEMDRDPEQIVRGSYGPGSWHCYTAIVDGSQTRIRVDGVDEQLDFGSLSSVEDNHRALLDGLTLGSDHIFGLSLCCGQGPGGNGAIAEVAVFRGHMNQIDMELLEHGLMKKHCIPTPQADAGERNGIAKRAHGLFCQRPGGVPSDPRSIPLKFMSQHHSVAWKQFDPVSGAPRRIQRIGARNGAESSDW